MPRMFGRHVVSKERGVRLFRMVRWPVGAKHQQIFKTQTNTQKHLQYIKTQAYDVENTTEF